MVPFLSQLPGDRTTEESASKTCRTYFRGCVNSWRMKESCSAVQQMQEAITLATNKKLRHSSDADAVMQMQEPVTKSRSCWGTSIMMVNLRNFRADIVLILLKDAGGHYH
ncbi:hypothetical protein BS78_01G448600 [Paspalum vaginatum]|nr:hypothetical protein BS78_01G448600 [Paspalum vaginatum]